MAAFRTFLGLFALVVVALVDPVLGVNQESTTFVPEGEEDNGEQCPDFDPNVECPKCDFTINPLGYLADKCDPCKFHQCEQRGGVWVVHHMACAPSTIWSQKVVTCVYDPNSLCKGPVTTESPGTDGPCRMFPVDSDPSKFVVIDNGRTTVMSCAPGTAFDVTACSCSIAVPVNVTEPKEIMCIDFDSAFGKWGFSAPGGNWVSNNGVTQSADGVKGKSGFFNGAAKLEIPFFTNNYNYKQFSVALWYKRAADLPGLMGILSNGACVQEGSVVMYSKNEDTVQMRADSEASQISLPFSSQVAPGTWHHLAIVFDFDRVSYFIDGNEPVVFSIAPGVLANRRCPLTLGLIGNGDYFTGNLDEVCFFKTALTKEQIMERWEALNQSPKTTTIHLY